MLFITASVISVSEVRAASMLAGVAKIDITTSEKPTTAVNDPAISAALGIDSKDEKSTVLIHDPLYAKALVLDDGKTKLAIITIDDISIGPVEGQLDGSFLTEVRSRIKKEVRINDSNILINASHNHLAKGQICKDVVDKIVNIVKQASENMVPVKIGAGRGYEDRIMMNRRLKLKNGKEWTIRHAIPCPPNEEVAGIGPMDPEIGILRIDEASGKTIAVLYNFACHPYTGVPGGGVTAEFPGFASEIIEESLGNGVIALFLQGAGGNITEVLYKNVNGPRDAKPFGKMLGLSTLKALKNIQMKKEGSLKVITKNIDLPIRTGIPERINALKAEQAELLKSLRHTSLNFEAFLPLYIKYALNPEYPSYYSYRYLQEGKTDRKELAGVDSENRRNIQKYLKNIHAMEKLARIEENMSHLLARQTMIEGQGSNISAEIQGIRIGDYVLITFSGELFVEIGLNIKKMSPYEHTYIAAYSNGHIGYAPTADAYKGEAYEDSSSILAPEWQEVFEKMVAEIINEL